MAAVARLDDSPPFVTSVDSCLGLKRAAEEHPFRPTTREVAAALSEAVALGLLTRVRIPDNQWTNYGRAAGSTDYTLLGCRLVSDPERLVLDLVSLHDGKHYEGLAGMLLVADWYPPSNSKALRSLVAPPEHPNAQERSEAFAKMAAPLLPARDQTKKIVTLDGRLRNTRALVAAGIPPGQIVVCETNGLTCLYQRLVLLGTRLAAVQILFCPVQRYLSSSASRRIVAANLDFCGDVPFDVEAALARCVHFALLGVTRCKRMCFGDFPQLVGFEKVATFDNPTVQAQFTARR